MSVRTTTWIARLATLVVVSAASLVGLALAVPSTASATSGRPGANDGPAVRTVTRSYGGASVKQAQRDQVVRIRFSGTKGDLVGLRSYPEPDDLSCERTALRKNGRAGSGQRLVAQKVGDLWRLPRTGSFVVAYRSDGCFVEGGNDAPTSPGHRATLQLMKVVTHDLVPGGAALDLPTERGYVHVAVVKLVDQRAVRVQALNQPYNPVYSSWGRILVPTSLERRTGPSETLDSFTCVEASPVVVRVGAPIQKFPATPYGQPGSTPAPLDCEAETVDFLPRLGDEIWFFDSRRATRTTASYAS